ncbi:MAG TPA: hypothetical protein VM008_07535 [Phycisphaerae bacterium]|nr:hypothetical protein [Phycisphaerae bacterium]
MSPPPQLPPSERDSNKDWLPTPIDWSVEFPRSPRHLSNQLRGKRFNADKPQLQLFDHTYHNLPAEVRQDVDKHNISVIGFDLSIAQQRAYDAALYLITATGAKSQRIVITPAEWLRAYGVEVRPRNTRDRPEMSSYERDEAFTALASLGLMPWLVNYDALVNGRWKTRREVATLWQVGTEHDKEKQEQEQASARPLTAQDVLSVVQSLKHAERISIKFHDIWFDQHDSFYFYKPAQLYQRLGLVMSGNIRRRNKHTHAFLDWIFSEVGSIRAEERHAKAAMAAGTYKPRESWTFSEHMADLAIQLRMTAQISKRNWSRIREALTDNAVLAQQAQIIEGFQWDGEKLSITFNQKTFADLDQYHQAIEAQRAEKERRRQVRKNKPEHKGVAWPFLRGISEYSYKQLQDMKRGQLAELAKIREKLRNEGQPHPANPYLKVPRQPTPREARDIAHYDAVVAMIDEALVPKPPAE